MDTVLTKDGRRKSIERRLELRCSCDVSLHCPPGEDPWFWINTLDAKGFYASHQGHVISPMIEYREVE